MILQSELSAVLTVMEVSLLSPVLCRRSGFIVILLSSLNSLPRLCKNRNYQIGSDCVLATFGCEEQGAQQPSYKLFVFFTVLRPRELLMSSSFVDTF